VFAPFHVSLLKFVSVYVCVVYDVWVYLLYVVVYVEAYVYVYVYDVWVYLLYVVVYVEVYVFVYVYVDVYVYMGSCC